MENGKVVNFNNIEVFIFFKLVSNYSIYEFSKWTPDFVKAIKQTWVFVG